MKKRTVITTEKREVWVISEGGVNRATQDQPDENSAITDESLTSTQQDGSNLAATEKEEQANDC